MVCMIGLTAIDGRRKGPLLTREGTDKIAGSSATLIECVSNFWTWSNATIPEVIRSVTSTPAEMLGLSHVKGTLNPGGDADLLVLDDYEDKNGVKTLKVEKVWKFGTLVHDASDEKYGI